MKYTKNNGSELIINDNVDSDAFEEKDNKFRVREDRASKLKFKRQDNAKWENTAAGVEYISPDQHSNIFGTIIRKYIDATHAADITGVSKLISFNIMTNKTADSTKEVVSTSESNIILCSINNRNVLSLALADGYTVVGGWVDYVKV